MEEDEGQGVPLAAMLAAWEKPTSRNREPRILTLDEVAVATCTGALTPARPSSTDLKSAVALGQIDDKVSRLLGVRSTMT